MARATTSSRTRTARSAEPAPKKRLGRPVGSKNRVTAATKAKTKTKARAKAAPAVARRSVPARRAAPAAPKLNKAELEAQVAKLERTVARLRKQNAELKQSGREEPAEAPKAAPTAVAKPKRATTPRPKRAAKAPAIQDDAADESHEEIDSSED